ncbi:type I polyketide synthase [Nodularia sp. UHCC 0506]|uniref:type I polyketide synthase n=1 Tax=Nodularia sp. UHCC 0506 TaxID=3110243 RepID=UPI002B215A30|nr:SDR family oxidoreductase [Nodularia sp. UHCC 0506]MEA5516071.1 SDR family oxidoreductase [Nodularia sp. UHCC 0506]
MNEIVHNSGENNGLEIAIIGMSGLFSGAKNLDEFWQNLQDGVESISFLTEPELEKLGIDAKVFSDPNYVKANGIVQDIDLFDASFFGFSPREAEIMDPQQRFLLEYAWEALENAGYSSEVDKHQIGVFTGSSINTYISNIYSHHDVVPSIDGFQISMANDPDFLSTRVSYKLNLQGPSYTVQTTCSTSLVTIHLACQSLLSGECDIALAGGVSISKPGGYVYQEGGIYSPDGHCRAFDAQAQGTVKGKGLGLVVLKRLEDALADGDFIHAVIKGSAINNDGSAKVSYSAPSINGQAKVIQAAQTMAEVEPETIAYIEAHGTGTSLGDPIEITALTEVFSAKTQKKNFCAIGSVKTNIGHLGPAAGVASLIKTVLALKHRQIPPSLHFETPNPQIDFANTPFYVNTQLSDWKTNGIPRRAGVSSFGFGGTNAHIILEEAPTIAPSDPSRPYQLLLLSAKTITALETATANLVAYMQQYSDLHLADVAYTLGVGRRAFEYRRILVCQDLEDALKSLYPLNDQRVLTHYQEPCNRPVVFMFSGQGSQYVNMGKELYENELIFTEQVDYCCELLKPHLGMDLRTVLYPNPETGAPQLLQTAVTQPALFVIEYALAKLWMSWGVHPEVMIGHSIGEYVAACLSGVFSLEDALALVAIRGKLMQQLPPGAMLSVQMSEQQVQPWLNEELSLAGSNSPFNCVISGAIAAIEKLQQQLQDKEIPCRRLHTSHAFHSQMMASIIPPFTQFLETVKLNPPKIPFISNVSGTWITATEATDSHYWARHLREPVRFSQGITELLKQPERILLEVGPGRTLSSLATQHQSHELVVLTSMRHPQEQQSDLAFLFLTIGRLWLMGIPVDWPGFYANERRHRIPLPTYPFERQRYWIETSSKISETKTKEELINKKPDIADWFYIPRWQESTPVELCLQEKFAAKQLCWLIFIDNYGVAAEIIARLRKENQNIITVEVGKQFARLDNFAFAINPQKRDHYDLLLQALQTQNLSPQGIGHFWSVTPNDILPNHDLDEPINSRQEFFEYCQSLGFYSLLFLAQALAEQNITQPIKLMVVSSNVHDVTGEECLCPEKATILGACKVIPQEYPHITCCNVDVVLPKSATKVSEKFINYLLAEFTAQSTDVVVAYRKHHRWVQTYTSVRLDESTANKTKLRPGGVYLITGGLGDIGLVLAKYLAQTIQAKLILLGRKGLPEKHQWSEWLVSDENAQISSKIKSVMELEELGAEVEVISADVANESQMQTAIAIATERFGNIHGVIHAAGIVDDAYHIIQETSQIQTQSQFHPKVYGLFILEKLLAGKQLDFCLLTSSSSSILGGLGLISYAAANIFMDVYAHKQYETNLFPCISVNWDSWQSKNGKIRAATIGLGLDKLQMTQPEGVEACKRILSTYPISQVVVSSGDLQTRIDQWIKLNSLRNSESDHQEDLFSHHQRPNLKTPYIAPRNEIEQTVAQIWQKLLGVQDIGIHDNFFELGGDSLLGTQIISQLRKLFQINLPLSSLFNEPTIAGISGYIEALRETPKKSFVFSTTALSNAEIEL